MRFLMILVLLIALSSAQTQNKRQSEDECREYLTCDICLEDPKCGWCEDYKLCVVGNSTGPDGGTCNWYYYSCSFTTTTLPPKNTNISWYQYGGNAQHTGYVEYNYKINSTTDYQEIFEVFDFAESEYASGIATGSDKIYFHRFFPGLGISDPKDYLCQYSFSTNHAINCFSMRNDEVSFDYSSPPSLSIDYRYVISLCGSTETTKIYPTVVDIINSTVLTENSGCCYYDTDVWSIISPVFVDNLDKIFFTGPNVEDTWYTYWTVNPLQQVGSSSIIHDCDSTWSHQPAYYNHYGYGHCASQLIQISENNTVIIIYSGNEIYVDSPNINNTISISSKNNIIFVVGQSLCAFSIQTFEKLWCNTMKGGSTQGTTPAIDDKDNVVYIYDNGYIFGYNQINGNFINMYGNGDVKNNCFLDYGCLSSQPIITLHNIFWGDGTNILIFDKKSQELVIYIDNVCGEFVGNSIAWYNEYLFVACRQAIIGYKFLL